MPRVYRSLSLLVLPLLLARVTCGAEANSDSEAKLARATKLVRQLGASEFRVRDSAAAELVTMGVDIKPVLLAAEKNPDLEVRTRAKAIATAILEADFQNRLSEFAADVDDAKHLDLPGWSRFKTMIGGDKMGRALFVELQRGEPTVMAAYVQGPEAVAKTLQARVHALASLAPMLRFAAAQQLSAVSAMRVGALYFVASDPDIKIEAGEAEELRSFYYYPPAFQVALNSGTQAESLKRIVGAWIAKDDEADAFEINLQFALSVGIKQALPLAVTGLKDRKLSASARMAALVAIDKFGGKTDLETISPLLKDTDVCRSIVTAPDQQIHELQVRDVALAVSIRLSGEDPGKFGYGAIQANQLLLFQPQSMIFKTAGDREAAFKKWADHVSAQKSAKSG